MYFTADEEMEANNVASELGYETHVMVNAIAVITPKSSWHLHMNSRGKIYLMHGNPYARILDARHQYHHQGRFFPDIRNAMLYIQAHEECRYIADTPAYTDIHICPKPARRNERRLNKENGKEFHDRIRWERKCKIREVLNAV